MARIKPPKFQENFPVREIKFGILNEGVYSGLPVVKVTLQGCLVGCEDCEVKETQEPARNGNSGVEQFSAESLVENILGNFPLHKNLLLTGGEPLMHNLDLLNYEALDNGLRLYLKTSGNVNNHNDLGVYTWVSAAPKIHLGAKNVDHYVMLHANEVKFVVRSKKDLVFANEILSKGYDVVPVFFAKRNDPSIGRMILKKMLKNPTWRMGFFVKDLK